MKILMVNKYLYPKGGAETYFLKIGKYLEQEGEEVEYFGMFDTHNVVTNSANQHTLNMDFHTSSPKKLWYPFKIIYSFEAKRAIGKVIEKFKPDIIHLNNINFQLTPAIIEEAHKKGIPIIQTVHDYQMICPNHLLFNIHNLKPCELCFGDNKWHCSKNKCIHGSKIKSFFGSLEALLYKKRRTYELVEQYICPSFFMEEKLLQNSIYKGKTVTIHNFIEQIQKLDNPKKENYVLYFGRLSQEKGLDLFLNCCKRLKNIKFIIAGSGPMEQQCYGVENVEFVGFKTGKELEEIIGKALFSVYPSLWYENCPLSILESESLGTPVIASAMGGITELIEHKQTGILVEQLEEKEFCEAIQSLYEDRELLSNITENCLNKRKDMITLESYCKLLMELYNSVLEKTVDN